MSVGRSWDRAPFVASSGSPTPPLDLVPGAAAAYSIPRLLRAGYAGPACKVIRLSDSAVLDIPFVGGLFSESTYTTFIGVSSGYLGTLYDQTGNGNHLTQAAIGSAVPLAKNAGFWGSVNINGPLFASAPDVASIQNIFQGGGYALNVVNSSVAFSGGGTLISKGSWLLYGYPGGGGEQIWFYQKASGGDGFWGTTPAIPLDTLPHLVTMAYNSSSAANTPTFAFDGSAAAIGTTTAYIGTVNTDIGGVLEYSNDVVINAGSGGGPWRQFETILYKGTPTSPNQALLTSNVKSFYGIP